MSSDRKAYLGRKATSWGNRPVLLGWRPLMTRKSLRPHLNQIRGWVRQGRTDAWIAHQLEVTVQQIEAFKKDNDLVPDEDGQGSLAAGATSRRPSTTAPTRDTGSGSTLPSATTRSTRSTGRGSGRCG